MCLNLNPFHKTELKIPAKNCYSDLLNDQQNIFLVEKCFKTDDLSPALLESANSTQDPSRAVESFVENSLRKN